jgi:DNA-binding XRE family transcriptional regulator
MSFQSVRDYRERKPTRPEDRAEIARRFRKLRRSAFLTQRALAGIISVCRQTVSEIEHRKVVPHDSTWDRFAALEAKHMQPPLRFPTRWE